MGKLKEQRGITITHEEVEGADHFFQNEDQHMQPMLTTVTDYVTRRLTEGTR